MPFAAALSTAASTLPAVREVCDRLQADLSGPVDLAVVFFSPHHAAQAEALRAALHEHLRPRALLGCIAEAVAGNHWPAGAAAASPREIEDGPALSVWVARWRREVALTPFHLTLETTADGPSLFGWPDALWTTARDNSPEPFALPRAALLLLGDPFTFPGELFLRRSNEDAAGVPALGGMASGIQQAGDCRLLLDGAVARAGAVAVLLEGDLGLRHIVSQGCRPIGRPLVITRANENAILELSGRKPFDLLRDLWASLGPDEQFLFQNGLHIGRVLNEYRGEFQRGDFLVRNVIGLEKPTGALLITDHVRVGQTVQFHVRDAASASEDLHALLQLDRTAHPQPPAGALLFTCNGRGTRLFGRPDHDADTIARECGAIPQAGFFAMGEFGPVGGRNFLHGFTASVALFEE